MPPKKKISAEEQTPALPSAATTTPHPLHGKNVVFNGTFKAKKVCEARVAELGGHPKSNVSSKTDIVVRGANAGFLVTEAIYRSIPVWTEQEFNAVCVDGALAVPAARPVPLELRCLTETERLSNDHRDALHARLTHDIYLLSFSCLAQSS